MHTGLVTRTCERLDALCLTHPDRHVGGEGVRAANELFAADVAAAGFDVERIAFDCVDWECSAAALRADGREIPLHVGPYSPPFAGSATLVAVANVEELEALEAPGSILLLHGAIAAEQLTPRHYPFYQMPEHQRILRAIDAAAPAAVIAATDTTPMAAALRPFPLLEDADAGFPSAYLLHTEGDTLLRYAGMTVDLEIDSRQIQAASEQLIARRAGRSGRRVIVAAHIDSRHGTPGALDNATGVAALLALADLLAKSVPAHTVELVPFNGEDNFAAYGEVAFLARHEEALADVALAINIDAAGRAGDTTALSFYGCPDPLRAAVLAAATRHERVAEGPEWPMSDHMVFSMRGVPAVALTSSGLYEISAEVAHTSADTPDLADPALVVEAAEFVRDVIASLEV